MIAGRVIAAIARVQDVPAERVSLDSSFEELGFDSLDGFNILFALEEEFDVEIPDEDARGIQTVRDAVEKIERLLVRRESAG
jgi:acyl carrier protein